MAAAEVRAKILATEKAERREVAAVEKLREANAARVAEERAMEKDEAQSRAVLAEKAAIKCVGPLQHILRLPFACSPCTAAAFSAHTRIATPLCAHYRIAAPSCALPRSAARARLPRHMSLLSPHPRASIRLHPALLHLPCLLAGHALLGSRCLARAVVASSAPAPTALSRPPRPAHCPAGAGGRSRPSRRRCTARCSRSRSVLLRCD